MMPRATDPARHIDALTAHLGWRTSADDEADLAALVALQGKPRRKVTAAKVLALIARDGEGGAKRRTTTILPIENPCAEGLARAARNGDKVSPAAEQRMQADKARARAERAARKPKA